MTIIAEFESAILLFSLFSVEKGEREIRGHKDPDKDLGKQLSFSEIQVELAI